MQYQNSFSQAISSTLTITKPILDKLIEDKAIPAAKVWVYKTIDSLKNAAVVSLLTLVSKFQKSDNEIKKSMYRIGIDLGTSALATIGKNMTDCANEIRQETLDIKK